VALRRVISSREAAGNTEEPFPQSPLIRVLDAANFSLLGLLAAGAARSLEAPTHAHVISLEAGGGMAAYLAAQMATRGNHLPSEPSAEGEGVSFQVCACV
jgi:hypothetical protein